MAERNDRNRRQRSYRDSDYYGSRQAQQFDDTAYDENIDFDQRDRLQGGQMGEAGGYRPTGNFYNDEAAVAPRRPRSYRGDRARDDYGERGEYEADRHYGPSRYDNRFDRGFQPFTGEDQGGRDFVRGGGGPYGGYGAGFGGGYSDYGPASREYGVSQQPAYGYRGDYRRDERGFFDRAGDEIASWFGDEDAARRRELDHRGRGPGHYTRSDERILEDACDSLTDDWQVDARNVQVTVNEGEVTLDGTVDNRAAKRRAEDCVEWISGVKHVQNNLRVQDRASDYSRETETGGA